MSSASTSGGFIWIKRYPLEVFGDDDKNAHKCSVQRLDCHQAPVHEAASSATKWQTK
jgi:hypothetical protein